MAIRRRAAINMTVTVPAQGSVITATLIFFVVVVNYIGDVVKQLMATVDGQNGGVPPGGHAAQPAALQAPPPPPDRGHVLQTGPNGTVQAEADRPVPADAASAAAVENAADSDATSSSSGDSPTCTECSVRRTASLTARGASDRLRRRRAGRSASARSSRGWDPMDSVFPPDGDSDSGRGPDPGDYAAQVHSTLSRSKFPVLIYCIDICAHICTRLMHADIASIHCHVAICNADHVLTSQVRAYVARETARRARQQQRQQERQYHQQHHNRHQQQREAPPRGSEVVDASTRAALSRAAAAFVADYTAADHDDTSSSASEDGSAGTAGTAAADAADRNQSATEAGGAHGGAAEHAEPEPAAAQPAEADGPAAQPQNADAAAAAAAPAARAEEDDLMDVPFEELIGLRGPWRQLFENAATVLASTFVFLLAMLWVPFMLGSFTMAAITRACPHCSRRFTSTHPLPL